MEKIIEKYENEYASIMQKVDHRQIILQNSFVNE